MVTVSYLSTVCPRFVLQSMDVELLKCMSTSCSVSQKKKDLFLHNSRFQSQHNNQVELQGCTQFPLVIKPCVVGTFGADFTLVQICLTE